MPMGPTFWAQAFGMATDRYGTPWMVSTTMRPLRAWRKAFRMARRAHPSRTLRAT